MTARKEKLSTGILLWTFWLVDAISFGAITGNHGHISIGLDLAEKFALVILLASWVNSDAQMRRQSLCYDFDFFVYVAWPFALLYYLFLTRGLRAFSTLLGFAVFFVSAILAGHGVFWLVTR